MDAAPARGLGRQARSKGTQPAGALRIRTAGRRQRRPDDAHSGERIAADGVDHWEWSREAGGAPLQTARDSDLLCVLVEVLRAGLAAEVDLRAIEQAKWLVLVTSGDHDTTHQAVGLVAILCSGLLYDTGRPAGRADASTPFATAEHLVSRLPGLNGSARRFPGLNQCGVVTGNPQQEDRCEGPPARPGSSRHCVHRMCPSSNIMTALVRSRLRLYFLRSMAWDAVGR